MGKGNYYPKVRGTVIRDIYKNGKLVERTTMKDSILNVDHWKGWKNFDRNFGRTYLKTNFDYQFGKNLMSYYSTEHNGQKFVYRRDFSSKTYLK